MAALIESPIWEPEIYQLETTDLVLGGPSGVSNLQPKQLANRTAFLYEQLGRIHVEEITVSTNLIDLTDENLFRNHVVIFPNVNNPTVVLQGVLTLPDNAIISLSVSGLTSYSGRNICLRCPAMYAYVERSGGLVAFTDMWLYAGESVTLIKHGSLLYMVNSESNMFSVGEILYSYKKPPSIAVEANGQLVSRSEYPRLWAWVQSGSGLAIPESTYQTNPLYYSGAFTNGNGTTTFRVPDLRGVFLRGKDNGRGIDVDRASVTQEGTYQNDATKPHVHPVKVHNPIIGTGSDIGLVMSPSGVPVANDYGFIGNNVGYETRGKNIAYTAYIKA